MKYYTGNDHISLINVEEDLTINGITTLSMGLNGNIFLDCVIKLRLYDGDSEIDLKKSRFELVSYWMPRVTVTSNGKEVTATLLAPKDIRGFIINIKGEGIRAEVELEYRDFYLNINTPHKINPPFTAYCHEHFNQAIIKFTSGRILLALAVGASKSSSCAVDGRKITVKENQAPGKDINFNFGLGCEDMAAISANVQFERQGYEKYFTEMGAWLEKRLRVFTDRGIERAYNTNLFFNYFFAAGKTIDTQELVCVTSRSPEYYVSGAYWDRDAMLWSFPAILEIDTERAGQALEYVFRVQGGNFGVHSRFINGNTLEYGFELDELCAPFIALESYYKRTGDKKLLKKPFVMELLLEAERLFSKWKDKASGLYRTELKPSDDASNYPFNTYDNVLVWKALNSLAYVLKACAKQGMSRHFLNLASKLKKSIKKNSIIREKDIFSYEFDMKGGYLMYEEPAGSLRLMHYYGFIDDTTGETYENTLKWIYSAANKNFFQGTGIVESGCSHAAHPWVLSACNSLLTPGYESYGVEFFKNAEMDNFVASESVDETTGRAATGRAFATCAGFTAYTIGRFFKGDKG